MVSYLAQVDVGKFTLETSTSAGGVPIRNYFAAGLESAGHKAFARTGDVLDYYAGLFGPYPFPVYGVVVPDAASGAAMENQTLSLYGRDVLEKRMGDPITGAIYLSHELAHQWFGDSVGFERWDDIWLARGVRHLRQLALAGARRGPAGAARAGRDQPDHAGEVARGPAGGARARTTCSGPASTGGAR